MHSPGWREMTRSFGRIGLLSFGGPAAQIALMHRELVERRGWLREPQFLGALSFCMLLPGPEAMQLATWAGWRLRGVAGGLLAGLFFVLPGALAIAVLALAYLSWGTLPGVQAAFLGVKALVIVVVVQALIGLGRRALVSTGARLLALAAFVAIFALGLPFPAIVAAAALAGALMPREATAPDPGAARGGWRASGLHLLIWGILWALPPLALMVARQDFLVDLSLFFAKLAVVSFGGAYAVLAWMAQAAVEAKHWLTAPQMIDALGLAETTPGPLILVTQFVGMLAGAGQGGTGMALAAGALTLWMTFVPCFLWIFVLAPHVERLLAAPRLAGALAGITAAVFGVILNLSIWFALHVLFGALDLTGPVPLPDPSTFRPVALALIALAALLTGVLKLGLFPALALMALAGLGAARIGGVADHVI